MSDSTGTAGPYRLDFIPAMEAPGGMTRANWRVTRIADDERIATVYDESNGRRVVNALNDTADRPGVELRRANSIEGDPYAFGEIGFANVYDVEALRIEDRAQLIVRQRILDDVRGAHSMLDMMDIPPGVLTARIGLMSFPRVAVQSPVDVLASAHSIASAEVRRRSHGSGEPLADADSVKIPKPDDVFAVLDQLTGEEAFKVFDHVGVLPGRTAEDRRWILTDADDVRQMVAECCAVALNTGKLLEVYDAAKRALARKGER